MPTSPEPFVVTFEHAQRSFKCARIEWDARSDGGTTAQWIVTIAGRPVWAFDATDADTRQRVQTEVERWWNDQRAPAT